MWERHRTRSVVVGATAKYLPVFWTGLKRIEERCLAIVSHGASKFRRDRKNCGTEFQTQSVGQ